jgi:hypothetical protein
MASNRKYRCIAETPSKQTGSNREVVLLLTCLLICEQIRLSKAPSPTSSESWLHSMDKIKEVHVHFPSVYLEF